MSHVPMFRGVVSLALLLSLGCSAMQQAILRDTNGFKVLDKGRWNQVKSYDVDPALRTMSAEQLRTYFAAGCKIRASRCTNGDYVLRGHVPGKGGGPISAGIAYGVTKTLAWAGLIGVGAGAVIATGGAVLATTGGATLATTGGASTLSGAAGLLTSACATTGGASAAVSTAAGLGTAAGITTGAAIVGTAAGATAATATGVAATVISTAIANPVVAVGIATGAAITAGIESISLGVGAIFLALPLP